MLSVHGRKPARRFVEPVASSFLRMGLSPNAVTLIGTACTIAIAVILIPTGHLQVPGGDKDHRDGDGAGRTDERDRIGRQPHAEEGRGNRFDKTPCGFPSMDAKHPLPPRSR